MPPLHRQMASRRSTIQLPHSQTLLLRLSRRRQRNSRSRQSKPSSNLQSLYNPELSFLGPK
jgi:hypothetical protein